MTKILVAAAEPSGLLIVLDDLQAAGAVLTDVLLGVTVLGYRGQLVEVDAVAVTR